MKFKGNLITLIFGYSFLYLPVFILLIFSFNDSLFMGEWSNFSFCWFKKLLKNELIWSAVFVSLEIATISATLSVMLGCSYALILTRFYKSKYIGFFGILTSAPLIIPEIVLGISLLLIFVLSEQLIGWPQKRGMMTIIFAHVTLASAYVVLILQSRLQEMDKSLEEAALDLGALPVKAFFHVTLPIIIPSLLSSWILSFALSFDDVVLSSFLTGAGATTLPILIFSSIRMGVTPEINALATFLVLFLIIIISVTGFLINRKIIKKNN